MYMSEGHHKKREESYCFIIEDALAWCIGWVEGCIVGCCFTWYMEEVVEPGIAEDMMMGAFRGYEDAVHAEGYC
jgi:hypothetical protein